MKTEKMEQTRSTGGYDANVVCIYEDLIEKCLVGLVECGR